MLAPLAAPVAFAVALGLPALTNSTLVILACVTVAAYACFGLLALPAIALLRRFHRLNLFALLVTGALLGALSFPGVVQVFAMLIGSAAAVSALHFAWGAGLGALVAIVFGLISGERSQARVAGRV